MSTIIVLGVLFLFLKSDELFFDYGEVEDDNKSKNINIINPDKIKEKDINKNIKKKKDLYKKQLKKQKQNKDKKTIASKDTSKDCSQVRTVKADPVIVTDMWLDENIQIINHILHELDDYNYFFITKEILPKWKESWELIAKNLIDKAQFGNNTNYLYELKNDGIILIKNNNKNEF